MNNITKRLLFFICIIFVMCTVLKVNVIQALEKPKYNSIIFINGIELKLRNIKDEMAYFKDNNNVFKQYVGMLYKENNSYMLPLRKTFDLAKISYTIDNNGVVLSKDDTIISGKFDSKNVSVLKDGIEKKIKLEKEIKKNLDKSIYVPLDILKLLNFNVQVQDTSTGKIIEIKDNDLPTSTITQDLKDEYKDVFEDIQKSKAKVKNFDMDIKGFINNKNITRQMRVDKEKGKIYILSGVYLENFNLGKMLLLKNGKIIEIAKREKSTDFLNYYVDQDTLDIADEIIIYCPYCKSKYIIKIQNPFRPCDCELD